MKDSPAQAWGALLDTIDLVAVSSLGIMGRTPAELVLAAYDLWECDIHVIDMDKRGRFASEESDWLREVRAALAAAGVPEGRIKTVRTLRDIQPWDVLLNLGGFGDIWRVPNFTPILERALHPSSRMLMDARFKSGAMPYLKDYGSFQIIEEFQGDEGQLVRRLIFAARPEGYVQDTSPKWSRVAKSLAGPDGFFTEGKDHSFLYVPRSKDVLVITFDNLDITMNRRSSQRPWGYEFIEKQGWSMLGVMAGGWTWYREPWVWSEFDRLRDSGFFKQFSRVVFYGASMGGYAAAAFSAACPGADVVIMSPQSTLDKRLVPWESRYSTAWNRDFSGPYGDAAKVSSTAARVVILYDPYEPLDNRHVERFDGDNVMALRAPLMGHRLGTAMSLMGILTPVVLDALNGCLTEEKFYRLLRARRDLPRYHRELYHKIAPRHPKLARMLGEWILQRYEDQRIRDWMKQLPE